jgi:hypothetical protein
MAQVFSTALPADVIPLASVIGLNAALALKAADSAVAKLNGSAAFTAPQPGVPAVGANDFIVKAQLDAVLGAASEIKPYANAAAADAAGNVQAKPMVIHLDDDGDGQWARYQILSAVATTFSAATKVKVADQTDITNLAGKADASALAAEGAARLAGDNTLTTNLAAETARALAAEALKADAADLATEVTGRTAADLAIAATVTAETVRATAAEGLKADATALATEITNRIAADAAVLAKIDAPKWDAVTVYAPGTLVSHNGLVWSANATPAPLASESPTTTPAAWTRVIDAIIAAALATYATQAWVSSQIAAKPWDVAKVYGAGDFGSYVIRNGLVYKLLVPSTGDAPETFPLVWEQVTAKQADLGKVRVSATDSAPDYLSSALIAGADIEFAVANPGAAEQMVPGIKGNAAATQAANFAATLARRRPLQPVALSTPVIASAPAAPAEGDGAIFVLSGVSAINTFAFAPGATVRGAIDAAGVTIADPGVKTLEVWFVNAAHGYDFRYNY